MSRQYDHWVFMQEEPLYNSGPVGRPVQIETRAVVLMQDQVNKDLQWEEEHNKQQDEYLERHKAG